MAQRILVIDDTQEILDDTDFYDPLLTRAVSSGPHLQMIVRYSCSEDSF